MAQLPPKIPTITHNCPSHHQQLPTWLDEFLHFSSARRGSHRSSSSASIFPSGTHGFDRLDEDQLMSMFSDDIASGALPPALSNSNPSSPSDQNSNNDEKPLMVALDDVVFHKGGEVESSCKNETPSSPPPSAAHRGGETVVDPKRVKRILANRQSAQRSRVRKLQYISELEKSVTTLQTEVSVLSPRVAFLDHQRLILNVDNSALKQRIAALAQDKIFKDAHQEALKKEIERLRQIYEQPKLEKMRGNSVNYINGHSHSQPLHCTEKEQLLS